VVLDAFSSDAIPTHPIPTHLLTREALALYVRRLAPGGALAFHVSNRRDPSGARRRLGAVSHRSRRTYLDRRLRGRPARHRTL